jgi:hypothetical protein
MMLIDHCIGWAWAGTPNLVQMVLMSHAHMPIYVMAFAFWRELAPPFPCIPQNKQDGATAGRMHGSGGRVLLDDV